MMRESSTASSKRSRRKAPTAMATDDDDHTDQHPPAAVASAAASVWTEEMHSSFLHRMEAAFVHNILFGLPAAGHAAAANHRHMMSTAERTTTVTTATTTPRLDRYVPDSAESTRDGHSDDASPASTPAGGIKRRRGRNARRNGCTAGDISMLSDGAKAVSTTRHHPLRGPPKGSDEDDDDQVVPLFQMPENQ